MAVKLTSINGKSTVSQYREYLLDSEADITLLPKQGVKGNLTDDTSDIMSNDPCAVGSKALICATGDVWILSPSNEWVKVGDKDESGSGGNEDEGESSSGGNGGSGVLWLDSGSIYEGILAWEDGTPITKAEFIEAFDTSRIMTRDTYTEGGKYTSTVVGYFINNSTSYIALHGMKAFATQQNDVKPVTFAKG